MKNNRRDYLELEKHFTAPMVISPFYGKIKRLPRKLKKQLSKLPEWNYNFLTIGQIMWYNLTIKNHDYTRFLIKKILQLD